MIRRLLLLIPAALFVGLSVFLYFRLSEDPSYRDSALKEQAFPDFSATALGDPSRELDRSLLLGELTLVNVWGEWCPACRQEMPQLLDLADKDIRMVGINYRDSREKGQQFLSEYGDPFDVNIFDPEGALGFELGVYGAPETFLVDAEGIIRYHHTGYVSPDDVRDKILPEVAKWQ